jgi:adenylate cyclase
MITWNAVEPDDDASNSAPEFIWGDVVAENDGDLMGNGVNIAARLASIAEQDSICRLGSSGMH